jgi:hypothetical protein
LKKCPSSSLLEPQSGLRHCRSPLISATQPCAFNGRLDSIHAHRPHRDEQAKQV